MKSLVYPWRRERVGKLPEAASFTFAALEGPAPDVFGAHCVCRKGGAQTGYHGSNQEIVYLLR